MPSMLFRVRIQATVTQQQVTPTLRSYHSQHPVTAEITFILLRGLEVRMACKTEARPCAVHCPTSTSKKSCLPGIRSSNTREMVITASITRYIHLLQDRFVPSSAGLRQNAGSTLRTISSLSNARNVRCEWLRETIS